MDIGIIEALKHNSSKNMVSKKQYENTVKSLKGQLAKKDKIINAMAKEIDKAYYDENSFWLWFEKTFECKKDYEEGRTTKIIEYFTKKVEEN